MCRTLEFPAKTLRSVNRIDNQPRSRAGRRIRTAPAHLFAEHIQRQATRRHALSRIASTFLSACVTRDPFALLFNLQIRCPKYFSAIASASFAIPSSNLPNSSLYWPSSCPKFFSLRKLTTDN